MRRLLVLSSVIGLALALIAPSAVVRAQEPVTTTFVSVTCFVDWDPDHYYDRTAGRGGQTEHAGAVFTNQLWVYGASGWEAVGTEIDTVKDQANYVAGTELFRGTFVVESTLGDFAGTFIWTEGPSGAGGHGQGHATDGSGLLWKSTAGVIDPTDTGVPACATYREVYNLTRLEVINP